VQEDVPESGTHEQGMEELKKLVGEAAARKFHVYLVTEQEREHLLKKAKEDRKAKWAAFYEQKSREEADAKKAQAEGKTPAAGAGAGSAAAPAKEEPKAEAGAGGESADKPADDTEDLKPKAFLFDVRESFMRAL
jgi:hypothetical protein